MPARSCSSRAPRTSRTASAATTRLAVDATSRASVLSLDEQEPDVGDDERIERSERANRGGGHAGLASSPNARAGSGAPTRTGGQPSRTVSHRSSSSPTAPSPAPHGPGEPEQRALPGIGAEPEVEPAAERVELDEHSTASAPRPGRRATQRTRSPPARPCSRSRRARRRSSRPRQTHPAVPPAREPRRAGSSAGPRSAVRNVSLRVGRLDDLVDAERE